MISYYCTNCNLSVNQSECPVCGKRTEIKSELFWCKKCNVPTYNSICPVCQNECKYFTSDVRPVFPEERLLIEIILNKPLAFINDSVWNGSGNRYYVNGKKIPLKISDVKQLDSNTIRKEIDKYKEHNSYNAFNAYIDKWILANKTHFESITTEAKQYINGISSEYLNDKINSAFVSFSGGKDSTVVSDLVRKALANPSVIHIFGNTTLEFPHTYEYIARFREKNKKTPMLSIENKEQDFFNLCETFGPPSRTLRWCCTIFKTGFIGEKIKSTFADQKKILTFYGIRRSESVSRNKYERSSDGEKISKQMVASPIIDWIDYDIWLYILTTKIDFNDAYKLGYTRVGCWCCPNNSQWSQFLASVYMPDLYKKFYDILYKFAVKMGKKDPAEYVVDGGWKARQGGAGIELSKNVAINFKPCATDSKSFNYVLNKPITEQLYELFKPFGILNFDMGKSRLGEVYILDFNTKLPIIKLQGRIGTNELKISILNTPIARRTKIVEIELKFKCQITKYQLCAGCHACENACKHNAIKLIKNGESDFDYYYEINENKCVHCFDCINHYTGGCYMRRVLLPRGKGYSGND
ncbi:MAG: phosphoadenosine phosphosulfate reductase family protein [Ruminococcaceae bacterium]|nr:phosphoadenosine phosphosulfate reductase family protein [Oscillospiraceae bacterium]